MRTQNSEKWQQRDFELRELQKWFQERYNVKTYGYIFFQKYLVKCDNFQSCIKKIQNFFTFKKLFPEYLMCDGIDEPDFVDFCASVYSFYLPVLTEDGYRIFFDRVTDDQRLFDVHKIMKYYCMQTEIRYLENETDNGDVILFDCNGVSLLHVVVFIPYFMKALYLILKIYPLQLKLLVFINTGCFAEIMISTLKMLLPRKKRSLLFVYKNGTRHFLKHVKANCLPTEYGGSNFTLNDLRDGCYQNVLKNHEWFIKANDEINNMEYENLEELRTTFGRNGTFKSLQID